MERVHVYGVLDSLRYVQRSGRVPALAAIAGSLLDIHPLLYIEKGQAAPGGYRQRRAVHGCSTLSRDKARKLLHAAVMPMPRGSDQLREAWRAL
jgi:fatty acid-binding protein DegV